jgi:DNA primase
LYNPENKQNLDYLKNRGLDEKIIKYFEFGYAPKDRNLIYRMASNADQMFGANRDKELI